MIFTQNCQGPANLPHGVALVRGQRSKPDVSAAEASAVRGKSFRRVPNDPRRFSRQSLELQARASYCRVERVNPLRPNASRSEFRRSGDPPRPRPAAGARMTGPNLPPTAQELMTRLCGTRSGGSCVEVIYCVGQWLPVSSKQLGRWASETNRHSQFPVVPLTRHGTSFRATQH
jgi:hypothetical protein